MPVQLFGSVRDRATNSHLSSGLTIQLFNRNDLLTPLQTIVTDDRGDYRFRLDTAPSLRPVSYVLRVLTGWQQLAEVMVRPDPSFQTHEQDLFVDAGQAYPWTRKRYTGGVTIDPAQLSVRRTDAYDIPELPGFFPALQPGEPTLPEQTQFIVLPAGAQIVSFTVEPGQPVRIPQRVKPKPVPTVELDVPDSNPVLRASTLATRRKRPVLHTPELDRGLPVPARQAVIQRTEDVNRAISVAIRVKPMQFDPRRQEFILYPNLQYTLEVRQPDIPLADVPVRTTRKLNFTTGFQQVLTQIDKTLGPIKPGDLRLPKNFPAFLITAPYVIITDDKRWSFANGQPVPADTLPADAAGKTAKSHFLRLAEWKARRGVNARVVTVSEIVQGGGVNGGKWGDFMDCGQGLKARDLAEVIRNFIRFAYKVWKTRYVLIGGDTTIVPMREMVSYVTDRGNFGWDYVYVNEPVPGIRKCYQIPGKAMAKLRHDKGLGVFSFVSVPDPADAKKTKLTFDINQPLRTLCNATTGALIPFNLNASENQAGWYFTAKADFTDPKKTNDFTRLNKPDVDDPDEIYLIVEGPQQSLSSTYGFYWLAPDRRIPTDFYYASVDGSCYGVPSRYDFDPTGTGNYGMFTLNPETKEEEPLLNSYKTTQDIWVGRAPVQNAEQAGAFVDKVLAYEGQTITGPQAEQAIQTMVFAADYFGGIVDYTPNGDNNENPAMGGRFGIRKLKSPAFNSIRIRLQLLPATAAALTAPLTPNFNLLAVYADEDIRIPYNPISEIESPRFYFMDETFSHRVVDQVTDYIEITGFTVVNQPPVIRTDAKELEGAAQEAEIKRQLMQTIFPDFQTIRRYYADYLETEKDPQPAQALRTQKLIDGISKGTHFLSLTGHGAPWSVCWLDTGSIGTLANTSGYFIAYGDACHTSAPDGAAERFGEKMVTMTGKGAVAYIGHTNMGYTWVTYLYEQFFWAMVAYGGPLGLAAGMRQAIDGHKGMWCLFTQTLYGDPEMNVWKSKPQHLSVTHAVAVTKGSTLSVQVRNMQNKPLAGQTVTLLGGWNNDNPDLYVTGKTDNLGQCNLAVPKSLSVSKAMLTVSGTTVKPYQTTVPVS